MNGKEDLIFENDCIRIKNAEDYESSVIMHDSEKKLMDCLASIVTQNGGHMLEIGFGMGSSATAIQEHPRTLSHTIIEIHPEIYKKALEWRENKPNIKIILGSWQDVLPTLDPKFKYNGILHDTFEDNLTDLLDKLKPLCAENCILGLFDYYDQEYQRYDEHFNIYPFEFSDADFIRLPYGDEIINTFFKNKIYNLKWITYKNGQFVKNK